MKQAGALAFLAIFILLGGALFAPACSSYKPPPGEKEATEYLGVKLTPIAKQKNNALEGTQHIDRNTYRLTVDGQVGAPLSLTYDDLLALPQKSRLIELHCVEGWSFMAKWTGPTLASILDLAKTAPDVKTVIFHTVDVPEGYSSLDLQYILDQNIIIALKLNDVTLPAERGFPFQVIAEGKFGYKWAKWVDRIELSAGDFRGYWEKYGYSNNADLNGPAFESGVPFP